MVIVARRTKSASDEGYVRAKCGVCGADVRVSQRAYSMASSEQTVAADGLPSVICTECMFGMIPDVIDRKKMPP